MSDADAPSANDDARAAPLLSARGLTVGANSSGYERVLVREVNFDLGAGETVAIVGESGSGKSITARALVGLLPAGVSASGSVSLAGEPLLTARSRMVRAVRGGADRAAPPGPVHDAQSSRRPSGDTSSSRSRVRCDGTERSRASRRASACTRWG